MTWDTEFGSEYAIEQPILDWFKEKGFRDDSWHNNICPSFLLQQAETDDYVVEIFVDAQNPKERESSIGPRFSVHWFDDYGDLAEHFDFPTFAQVGAHFARVMETKS